MKNFTTSFININELELILNDNKIQDSSRTLIQVFLAETNLDSMRELQVLFQKKYPKAIFLGTTTDGVLEGSKVHNENRSALAITSFTETRLKSVLLQYEDYSHDSYTIGKELAKQLVLSDTKAIISFADGIQTNGEEYLNGINSVNHTITVSGGLSADNGKISTTYVFDKDTISSHGVIGVSLNNENLDVTTSYSFDWMPIGKKMRVSKSIANRIYEIDGMSAVDVYAKYMGHELAKQLPQIGIEFPLIFEEDNVSIGRAVLFKHDDGSLTFAGNIKQGTYVRFGVGNIDKILQSTQNKLNSFCKKLEYKPEAIFIYSCMARRRFMKEHIEDELKTIGRLGNISGFFTYGEFYSSNSNHKLLNETMTVLALSENKKELQVNLDTHKNTYHAKLNNEQVIANLANVVSNELAELNKNLETRVKKSANNIYKQAFYDKLTSLPNRIKLIKNLHDETKNKVLFLINIDNFTIVNDFYGYKIGDILLKKLAFVLENMNFEQAFEVFKLQSDEFAILSDMPHNHDDVENKIKKIIAIVESTEFVVNNSPVHLSVSISASHINKANHALRDAEVALKIAKKSFKDYVIYDESLKEKNDYINNMKMANIIKNAITSNGIIPYFQPIFDSKTGQVEKYESLVRLQKEDGSILSPFFFLDISQKIKLYSFITEIMITKVFSYFSSNGLNFSINIAMSDILNIKTRVFLFEKIDAYKIGKQLTIEILETQEIENEKLIFNFIDEVYARGAKIAIDDFGSGFANFQHMTSMRSDYMKIDGSLIKNIDTDTNARLIVETIIIFAKKLKKKTIAEYVHSKEVYKIIKELDVDYIQGYYLGEPKGTVI